MKILLQQADDGKDFVKTITYCCSQASESLNCSGTEAVLRMLSHGSQLKRSYTFELICETVSGDTIDLPITHCPFCGEEMSAKSIQMIAKRMQANEG